uniref:Transmembrane protein n=1 Tax=Zooxanthella nutricula TaxID=1333877 RepID=A0A7S2LV16_9DINO
MTPSPESTPIGRGRRLQVRGLMLILLVASSELACPSSTSFLFERKKKPGKVIVQTGEVVGSGLLVTAGIATGITGCARILRFGLEDLEQLRARTEFFERRVAAMALGLRSVAGLMGSVAGVVGRVAGVGGIIAIWRTVHNVVRELSAWFERKDEEKQAELASKRWAEGLATVKRVSCVSAVTVGACLGGKYACLGGKYLLDRRDRLKRQHRSDRDELKRKIQRDRNAAAVRVGCAVCGGVCCVAGAVFVVWLLCIWDLKRRSLAQQHRMEQQRVDSERDVRMFFCIACVTTWLRLTFENLRRHQEQYADGFSVSGPPSLEDADGFSDSGPPSFQMTYLAPHLRDRAPTNLHEAALEDDNQNLVAAAGDGAPEATRGRRNHRSRARYEQWRRNLPPTEGGLSV